MGIANRDSARYVADMKPFTGSNLSGGPIVWRFGYLPDSYRQELGAAMQAGTVDYALYSYGTPIAWHTTDAGWIIPPVKYSATTSKHLTQSRVRDLVSL